MSRFILILSVVASLSACAGGLDGAPKCDPPKGQGPVLGESFNIAYGEQTGVVGEGLVLAFEQVLGESRCPLGVQCVWAGNARIGVRVEKTPGEPAVLVLNTHSRFATEATYQSYTIALLRVAPYPEQGRPVDASSYCATLKVTRSGGA